MHKPTRRNSQSPKKPVDWLEYVNSCSPGLVIPVGARFQVDVPEWTESSRELYLKGNSDNSKWLGTRIWPLHGGTFTESGQTGKRRSDSCSCASPGSQQCRKNHMSEERKRLIAELGSAYKSWKLDEMGDEVAKTWSSRQVKRFETLVKANPLSNGKSFLQPAELSFTSKTRKDIVSYYLNVYVPKRISMLTQSGIKELDSDDDEVLVPSAKNAQKRPRCDPVESPKPKSHYLTGRR